MRHFYRSHGKHCHLRSFKTNCSKCGGDVLYWECTHGSKIFFNYPPYGKLIKHICQKTRQKISNNKYKVIVKNPKKLMFKQHIICSICGKIFKNKENLNNHINQLKKTDYFHHIVNTENKDLEKNLLDQTQKEKINGYKPVFGKLNFRNKNK